MHSKHSRGFTLVELMVTAAVVTILAMAAAPSLRDFFERYRLRSAVEEVLAVFATARQGAVEADRNVKVKFSSNVNDWCVGGIQQEDPAEGVLAPVDPAACVCESAAGTCLVGGEQLVASVQGRGVSMSSGGLTMTFDSKNGTLTPLNSQSVTFLSSTGRYGLEIQVSALGQARACRPASKDPFPGYPTCS